MVSGRCLMALALTLGVAAVLVAQPAPGTGSGTSPAAAATDPYRQGQQALDEGRWADAAAAFTRAVAARGNQADAALYWLAWAEHKAGRRGEAMAALDRLAAEHGGSPWRDDAEALRIEIAPRAAAGGGTPGEAAAGEEEPSADDELKLFALHSLMNVEPERALPPLRKVLASNASRNLREQALFVLSQHDSPEALALLQDVARGKVQPDLQLTAIDYLGLTGESEALGVLDEVYRNAGDQRLKAKILESYMVAGATDRVLAVAKAEADAAARSHAVELLGVMDARPELRALYAGERDAGVRGKVLEALALAGDLEFLREAARDSDAAIRRRAVEGIGMVDDPAVRGLLQAIYRTADRETRRAVLDAFLIQDDALGLVAVARAETDRELKREALERLAMMDSDEAREFLLESLD
jgi:hypothetical protein